MFKDSTKILVYPSTQFSKGRSWLCFIIFAVYTYGTVWELVIDKMLCNTYV